VICSTKFELINAAMRKTYLGELEEVVLLTTALLYEEAYGVAITEKLGELTGRSLSISAVHATLHRLEEKGFLHSYTGGATAERGGRRKRYFTLTSLGSRALCEIRQMRELFWNQIPIKALDIKVS
jgi:PadR family transcriptional regulator, regulatory protein PadR